LQGYNADKFYGFPLGYLRKKLLEDYHPLFQSNECSA